MFLNNNFHLLNNIIGIFTFFLIYIYFHTFFFYNNFYFLSVYTCQTPFFFVPDSFL